VAVLHEEQDGHQVLETEQAYLQVPTTALVILSKGEDGDTSEEEEVDVDVSVSTEGGKTVLNIIFPFFPKGSTLLYEASIGFDEDMLGLAYGETSGVVRGAGGASLFGVVSSLAAATTVVGGFGVRAV